jgi:hypothetical protein
MHALLATLILANSPAPDPCDADPKRNELLTFDALKEAQRHFPPARVATACTMFGSTMQVQLQPFEFVEGGVQFRTNAMVQKERGGWLLVPFNDRPSLGKLTAQLKTYPLMSKVLPAPFCLAGTDAPGRTWWFRCRAAKFPDSTPSSGHIPGDQSEFEFARYLDPPPSCGCAVFSMENYSAPLRSLPARAPGWCSVKDLPAVKAFVAAHGVEQVTVARWHGYTVKLRAKDGATHEEPLKTGECYCSPLPECPDDAGVAPRK